MSAFYTLGVDPAKRKLTAVLLSPQGQVLLPATDFESSRGGYESLLSHLRHAVSEGGHLVVGTEATASLDDNFLLWLNSLRESFTIVSLRLDPAQVAHFTGPRPIRGKTDSADALRIARFTQAYAEQLTPLEADPRAQAMSRLVNERARLVYERTALRNRLHDRVNLTFPEIYQVFKNPCLQTPMALLALYPTAREIARRRESTIAAIQPAPRAGKIGVDRARKLLRLARTSIASATESSDGEALQFLIEQIRAIDARLHRIDETLEQWVYEEQNVDDEDSLQSEVKAVETIPGAGFAGAVTTVLRVGGIRRFLTAKALSAQLGTCPDRNETGGQQGKGWLTHRGDRRTRSTVYMMALMASLADPAFAFHKWRFHQKGQTKKQAVCSIMNKLASIIWAVVHREGTYDPERMYRNILIHHRNEWVRFIHSTAISKKIKKKIPQWMLIEA